jgi:oxygen-dependent protoporphyrinogen oxidase
VGLEGEILPASPSANIRYILKNQKLTKLPGSLLELVKSPFFSTSLRAVFRDLTTGGIENDCTIGDFIRCRLGEDVLENFINPLVSGVYAGDPEALSIQSCFPSLFTLQKERGSLCKGMLMNALRKNSPKEVVPFSLFTLKRGLHSLIERLVEKIGDTRVRFNASVKSVTKENAGWLVTLENGEKIICEKVISTLPGKAVEKLWRFQAAPTASVAVVNLGYSRLDTPLDGFGYLVPAKEKEPILGVVWDSKVFPEQQVQKEQGRLTVMIGGSNAPEGWRSWDLTAVAIDAVKRHMGISKLPDVTHISIAENAIPQYEVGYANRLDNFIRHAKLHLPNLEFGGAFIDGVAINDCIHGADKYTIAL